MAALFHDVATPCFSHVIDYMNKDYVDQESTEEYTDIIMKSDQYLLDCLKKDGIAVEEISDFKKYSIVDSSRPKLCADRLDGVILTGLFWTKNLDKKDVVDILSHTTVFNNEDNRLELGFNNIEVARKVMSVNDSIDLICHSNEDNYMMELLSNLTRYIIENDYITYDDLYRLNEDNIHDIFNMIEDDTFKVQYRLFKTIKLGEVPYQQMPNTKRRGLNLLVNGRRIYKHY